MPVHKGAAGADAANGGTGPKRNAGAHCGEGNCSLQLTRRWWSVDVWYLSRSTAELMT